MKPLTEAIDVLTLDFSNPLLNEQCSNTLNVISSGQCDALLFWWSASVGPEEISTAPAFVAGKNFQWRDHWKQCLYGVKGLPLQVDQTDIIQLSTFHDETTVWFEIEDISKYNECTPINTSEDIFPPVCVSGIHVKCSRMRCWMLNDSEHDFEGGLHQEIYPLSSNFHYLFFFVHFFLIKKMVFMNIIIKFTIWLQGCYLKCIRDCCIRTLSTVASRHEENILRIACMSDGPLLTATIVYWVEESREHPLCEIELFVVDSTGWSRVYV